MKLSNCEIKKGKLIIEQKQTRELNTDHILYLKKFHNEQGTMGSYEFSGFQSPVEDLKLFGLITHNPGKYFDTYKITSDGEKVLNYILKHEL